MPTKSKKTETEPVVKTLWEQSAELMFSKDYQDRFRAEYYQIETRLEALGGMLKAYVLDELAYEPACSIEFLRDQYLTMRQYRDILLERAQQEGIDL